MKYWNVVPYRLHCSLSQLELNLYVSTLFIEWKIRKEKLKLEIFEEFIGFVSSAKLNMKILHLVFK
jgi:hypothetical protein